MSATKVVKRTAPKRAEPNRTRSVQTLLRMTEEDRALLDAVVNHHGISIADLMVMLVRGEARRVGIAVNRKPSR